MAREPARFGWTKLIAEETRRASSIVNMIHGVMRTALTLRMWGSFVMWVSTPLEHSLHLSQPLSPFRCSLYPNGGTFQSICLGICLVYEQAVAIELSVLFLHADNDSTHVRGDQRCGDQFPMNGRPGECDSDGGFPCCSNFGWCGISRHHCQCVGCKDYRLENQKQRLRGKQERRDHKTLYPIRLITQ